MDRLNVYFRIKHCIQNKSVLQNFLFLNNRVGLNLKSAYNSFISLEPLHWYLWNLTGNHTLEKKRHPVDIPWNRNWYCIYFFQSKMPILYRLNQYYLYLDFFGSWSGPKHCDCKNYCIHSNRRSSEEEFKKHKHSLAKADGCNDLSTSPPCPPFSSSLLLLWSF